MRSVILAVLLSVSSFAHADRIRLLADDKEALQARVDLLQQAQNEILVEYFSVWNDPQSAGAFALLYDAAKRGVKIKVIMDAFSNTVPAAVKAALIKNGKGLNGEQNIEIRLYNPLRPNIFKLTHRDHAKLIIADGARMITGGRNVGDKYFGLNKKRNFSDMDVFLDGQAVTDAREDFYAVWNSKIVKDFTTYRYSDVGLATMCLGVDSKERGRCEAAKRNLISTYNYEVNRIETTLEEILTAEPDDIVRSGTNTDWLADIESGAEIQYLSHQPDKIVSRKSALLSHALKELASNTQSDLNVLSPYLIPTKSALALFETLIKKGVKVRIITNSIHSTDNLFAQAGYQHYKDRLIKIGVELYEYNGPDTAHAKVAVVDGHIAFVGTYNLDPRSAFINREVGIIIKSSPQNQLATTLTAAIEDFRGSALLVGKDGVPRNEDIQRERYKSVSKFKKAQLQIVKLILPFIKSQI